MELEKTRKKITKSKSASKGAAFLIDKKVQADFAKLCKKKGLRIGRTVEIMVNDFIKANS